MQSVYNHDTYVETDQKDPCRDYNGMCQGKGYGQGQGQGKGKGRGRGRGRIKVRLEIQMLKSQDITTIRVVVINAPDKCTCITDNKRKDNKSTSRHVINDLSLRFYCGENIKKTKVCLYMSKVCICVLYGVFVI